MNILEAEDIIKGLPDQRLMEEAQAPSGQVPQFLVVSEIQRRTDMRKRYQDQQQPQGTVADQIVQEGIMGTMPPQPMMPQAMPPQVMPPQQMFSGGIIRLQEGGSTNYEKAIKETALYEIQAGDTPSKIARMFGVSVDELLSYNEAALGGRFDVGVLLRNPREKEIKIKAAYADGVSVEDIAKSMRLPPNEVFSLLTDVPETASGAGIMDVSEPRQVAQLSPVEVTAQRMEPDMAAIGLGAALRERPEFAYPPLQEVSVDAQRIEPMVQPSASTFATMPKMSETIPPASLRIADSLGFFDDMKEDARQRNAISNLPAEPMASAIANKLVDRYMVSEDDFATARQVAQLNPVEVTAQRRRPDMSLLSPVEVTAQRMEPASIDDSLPNQSSGGLASLYKSLAEAGSASLEDAASRRQDAADFFSGLEDYLTPESVIRARQGLPTGRDPLMFQSAANQQDLGLFQGYYDEMMSPKPGQVDAPEALKDALELAQENTQDASKKGVGALYEEDGIEKLLRGGPKEVQGTSRRQAQALPDAGKPDALDFSDLIKESKDAAMANALMQLGAGIAGGDLSKGISAAGIAATKGQQDARAMAIRKRLAEYQAGREDIARAEKAEQFDRQMKALETRYANELAKAASVGRNELFRTVTSLVEAAMEGSTEFDPAKREAMVEAMMKKYLSTYAPAFDVDPETVSFGMREDQGSSQSQEGWGIAGR